MGITTISFIYKKAVSESHSSDTVYFYIKFYIIIDIKNYIIKKLVFPAVRKMSGKNRKNPIFCSKKLTFSCLLRKEGVL